VGGVTIQSPSLRGGHNLFENLLPCNHNKGVTFFDVKNQVGKAVTSSDNLTDLCQMYNIQAKQEVLPLVGFIEKGDI